ncbi:MAG: hypothetical protein GWN84_04935, partial [Gammaproteobacteria bacterium]|nr:hypothetical protein [Gammaproteobacteria bacterium]NIR82318.1 hypothetical protein [Gammaproteobacteria bacterium]NIU03467.1 hypothetical protein [Gammaproteobacteria bacterium]NIV50892.1 hypothetical protein [Gammaproteobacteria bacterium]NIV76445.1 hypothetical protein [Gammaproteobacteria bacterium]
FIRVVDEKLRRPDVPDLVAMKVAAEGAKGGEAAGVTFRLLDYFDRKHAISAMMRTTGFSLSITGQ